MYNEVCYIYLITTTSYITLIAFIMKSSNLFHGIALMIWSLKAFIKISTTIVRVSLNWIYFNGESWWPQIMLFHREGWWSILIFMTMRTERIIFMWWNWTIECVHFELIIQKIRNEIRFTWDEKFEWTVTDVNEPLILSLYAITLFRIKFLGGLCFNN